MSKLENTIKLLFDKNNIKYIEQYYKDNYKFDFYLPNKNIYIELKGFLTLESMFKIENLLRDKNKVVYLFQATELLYLPKNENLTKTKKAWLKLNIIEQLNELINYKYDKLKSYQDITINSLNRLYNFRHYWFNKYKNNNINI